MSPCVTDICLPLFVPGDRPDRFAKAASSGADCVIVDLEDAVAPDCKSTARRALINAFGEFDHARVPVVVRINGAGSQWYEEDLAALSGLPVAGAILPKAEQPGDLERLAAVVGSHLRVIALIESVVGLANVRGLATRAGRLALGSIDLTVDLRSSQTRDALLLARLELVLASRLAGLEGPIDGITTTVREAEQVESDAAYAASLGFAGKLLIHPSQIAPARRGFLPSELEIGWAENIVRSVSTTSATVVDGTMVDAAVLLRAHNILRCMRHLRTSGADCHPR